MNSSLRLTVSEHGVTQPSPVLVRTSAWLGCESNPMVFVVPRVTVAHPPLSAASNKTNRRRITNPLPQKIHHPATCAGGQQGFALATTPRAHKIHQVYDMNNKKSAPAAHQGARA